MFKKHDNYNTNADVHGMSCMNAVCSAFCSDVNYVTQFSKCARNRCGVPGLSLHIR